MVFQGGGGFRVGISNWKEAQGKIQDKMLGLWALAGPGMPHHPFLGVLPPFTYRYATLIRLISEKLIDPEPASPQVRCRMSNRTCPEH